jgi:hypothetical protein
MQAGLAVKELAKEA